VHFEIFGAYFAHLGNFLTLQPQSIAPQRPHRIAAAAKSTASLAFGEALR
jgi:hypothetical protein